eukprot:2826126-Pyramimonas_sp.AAC.1
MSPYVPPIVLKTFKGANSSADLKRAACSVLKDPKPMTNSTTTLPDLIADKVINEVGTPVDDEMSLMKFEMKFEAN